MLTKTSARSKKVEQHDTELCENQAGCDPGEADPDRAGMPNLLLLPRLGAHDALFQLVHPK
jgi:hypothetical protein